MAGVSDAPFRQVCQSMGAGLTTSEMLTANTGLWHSRKSSLRLLDAVDSQSGLPRSIQIAGSEPATMAEAARQCVDLGAEIVDINMGCPAKKVCNKAAGSALLRDETLVAAILSAVVNAVAVPVTLKIRTGWCQASRNGTRVAQIAEQNGISALTVHGRTRACRFTGEAEYETIAAIVEAVDIPVIANGDIDSPQKAHQVLQTTGANAVMIGRAVQGQPWLIREIDYYLKWKTLSQKPSILEVFKIVSEHLQALYNFYGDFSGAHIARKHLKWYSQRLIELCCGGVSQTGQSRLGPKTCATTSAPWKENGDSETLQQQVQAFTSVVNKSESPDQQQASVRELFERLITREEIAA